MATIFISFIHEEEKVAEALQQTLREEVTGVGRDVFMSADQWQMFAGELWLERLRKELTEAHIVILMLSKLSVERRWINFEAGFASYPGDKLIIPACFGGLSKDSLPEPYSRLHALNLKNEAYFLLNSICDRFHQPSPIPERLYRRLYIAIVEYEESLPK